MAECIQVKAGRNWEDGDPMDAPTSFGFLDIEHLFVLPKDFFRVSSLFAGKMQFYRTSVCMY